MSTRIWLNQRSLRLVVFDVEGVLIPKNRFFFEVGKTLGLIGLFKVLFWGFLYEAGIIKLESALRHIYGDLKGIKNETILQQFSTESQQPLIFRIFVHNLKRETAKLPSSAQGYQQLAVKKLATLLCADYAYGVEVELKDGRLTGEIWRRRHHQKRQIKNSL